MSSASDDMALRHGRNLEELAELGMTLARKLHERAMEAEDPRDAERLAQAFHHLSRSVRQTMALEARLERDRRRDAVEARRLADEDRRERVKARKAHVGNVGARLIWTEAERGEIGELLVDLRRWCDEEAFHEERFLQGPVEAVIERLKKDLGLAARQLPPSPPPPSGGGGPPKAVEGAAPPGPQEAPSGPPGHLPRFTGEEKAAAEDDSDWWSTPEPDWQSSA